jgi:S-adenosylmethionine-diacylgycerolhomoserine-N-methlytransferase
VSTLADLRVIFQLLRTGGSKSSDHATRLNQFYQNQAGDYDEFRKRLLPGREQLISSMELPEQARVVDLGGGTGGNLEALTANQKTRIAHWHLVDLCRPLLDVAGQRCHENTYSFVQLHEADATKWQPEAEADLVLLSYSLTMIPDWIGALENALRMLKPGGQVAVVDFYVSRKYSEGVQHGAFTRHFWPLWFSWDNVFLSQDHLPWLQAHTETVRLREDVTRLPFLPGSRVPWYSYVGRKTRG